MRVHFISGHLDLTQEEFDAHYKPAIDKALMAGDSFVVGDARGADRMAAQYLLGKSERVKVYHMFSSPRHDFGFPTNGGFRSDHDRDAQMTADSDTPALGVDRRRTLNHEPAAAFDFETRRPSSRHGDRDDASGLLRHQRSLGVA